MYMLRGVQQLPCCCGPMYNKDEVGHLRLCIDEDTMMSQLLHTLLQVQQANSIPVWWS